MKRKIDYLLIAFMLIAIVIASVSLYYSLHAASAISALDKSTVQLSEKLDKFMEETLKPAPQFPKTIKDMLGREVIIPKEPERIVSMAPSITETLFALGLKDKVIGVTKYCDYPPDVPELVKEGKIEVIGGFTNPSVEKIVKLEPDLVIAVDLQERFVTRLESLGVIVVAVKAEGLSDIYSSIALIGRATGRYEDALKLNSELKSQIKSTWEKVLSIKEKVKVLHIAWFEPLYVAGGKSYVNDIITMAGGINIFEDSKEGWPVVSPEAVVEKQPDIIIVSGHAYPGKSPEEVIKYIKSVPGWKEIKAVKENRVFMLTDDAENALVRPGPRIAKIVQLLAKIFYPKVFGVTLPQVIAKTS